MHLKKAPHGYGPNKLHSRTNLLNFTIALTVPTAKRCACGYALTPITPYILTERLRASGNTPAIRELRTYDDLDITALAHSGENSIMIRVWHYGAGSQTHAPGKAGLIYELYHETELLAFSSPNTLSCLSALYTSHSCEFITTQLGFNYHVDNTRPANILTPSQAEKPSCAFVSRPIEKLVLRDRINAAMIQKGAFSCTAATTQHS